MSRDDISDPRVFRWVESGVSGLAAPRRWDASGIVDAPSLTALQASQVEFVVLAEGAVAGNVPPDVAATLVQGLALDPPYRALAVRRGGDTWAVGAIAIEVAELPADIEGEELMLTVNEQGERELSVDGRPSLAEIESLAALAGGRHAAFVLRARRLQKNLWELTIDPL